MQQNVGAAAAALVQLAPTCLIDGGSPQHRHWHVGAEVVVVGAEPNTWWDLLPPWAPVLAAMMVVVALLLLKKNEAVVVAAVAAVPHPPPPLLNLYLICSKEAAPQHAQHTQQRGQATQETLISQVQ